MRQFFEEQFEKSRLAKVENRNRRAPEPRAIWDIMLHELKIEEFEKRVFHDPHLKSVKEDDNVMDSYELRSKKKNSKNPMVWKPDRFRWSKDLRILLEAKGFTT